MVGRFIPNAFRIHRRVKQSRKAAVSIGQCDGGYDLDARRWPVFVCGRHVGTISQDQCESAGCRVGNSGVLHLSVAVLEGAQYYISSFL